MTLINPDEVSMNKSIVNSDASASSATIKIRKPKRILHFSDGILEEYSSDEDEIDTTPKQEIVDPATLTWGPWLWYKTWKAGAGTLYCMDTAGEYLAAFFGITTPKYYFELEEYKKNQARNEKEEEERKGWSANAKSEPGTVELEEITTNQPKPVDV